MNSNTTFMTSPKYFLTSESVTEGHPDKICDQVSDAVLDAMLEQDPMSRVACECGTTTGMLVVMGEITTEAYVEIGALVRDVLTDIGYVDTPGFDANSCGVMVSIKEQSPDIAQGVDEALEARTGEMSEEEIAATGAGDQGMMFGFACNETPEYMPATIMYAHKICRRLAEVRKNGEIPYLRPDGKSQVTVEYAYGKPKRVDAVVVSTQHNEETSQEQIREDVIAHVIKHVIPADLIDEKTKFFVNPTGRFAIGGPAGDSGLTGRKIIVDTYGGVARHGGGAFSGKDATKVDRSATYMMRYIAKNLVAAGVADRVEVQVSYAIGVAQPISVAVETFGTGKISDDKIAEIVNEQFDLRPAAIIRDLELRKPGFRKVAAYGHFGRDDLGVTWERLDKVEAIKKAAGLKS